MSDIQYHNFKVGDLVVLSESNAARWVIEKHGIGVVVEDTCADPDVVVYWQSNMAVKRNPYFHLKTLDKLEKS